MTSVHEFAPRYLELDAAAIGASSKNGQAAKDRSV